MTSFTQAATLTLVQATAEAHLHEMMQTVLKWLQFHLVNNLIDEGKLQEEPCLIKTHTALLHIEKRRVVELTHRRPMVALHVVSIYLKHRLGVHVCLLSGAEVLVGFLRDSLLSTMADEYLSCKSADRLVVEDVLIQLVAGAMADHMVDERVVVDMLLLVGDDTTVA